MFKNSKILKRLKNNILIKKIRNSLRSLKVRIFISMLAIVMILMGLYALIMYYFYGENMAKTEVISMQNSCAVITGEFEAYGTLIDAENAGMFKQIMTYSNLGELRIRIVDWKYRVLSDTYSVDKGKTIINPRVIEAFTNKKSITYYNRKIGVIEIAMPIYNDQDNIMGVMIVDKDYSEESSYVTNLIDNSVTTYVTLIFTFVLILYVMMKLLKKDISNAFNTVKNIADGHTEKRIDIKGGTELEKFAKNFNVIMDRVNAKEETRQEFVSNVSHELKTPLTSIKVLADSLNSQEDVPVELYKEFMSDITNEIDRESKIIEDLLTLVKMDKNSSEVNISSVNINDLMELILKRLKPIAQKKNVELLFESFRPVVAEVDEVKFTLVISNLVENAIKYNNINGWVHVSLNADYQYFYVRVEDSGIGIPKESQNMVFERFYRVDKARSRETGGTGLGLAIVQRIVLLHHGTIKLHSEEGNGTTFTVRIPLNYVD